MQVLVPNTITTIANATLAEPNTGETEWVSAASYTLGDVVIRTTTHRQYAALQTHTGRTALPEDDPTYWDDIAPTDLWAPFDNYVNTAATADGTLSYTISPGFFDTFSVHGAQAQALTYVVSDSADQTLASGSLAMYEDAMGLQEYLFSTLKTKSSVIVSGLPIYPDATLTVTLLGDGQVSLGMLNIGMVRNLVSDFGGTEYGATAEPITYSRIATDDFGNTTIIKRHAATSMRASVVLAQTQANAALRVVQEVLDVPCTWIASAAPGYEGLIVFGLANGVLSYEGPTHARLNLMVKGLI